jgi:uncharacterized Zn finger protein
MNRGLTIRQFANKGVANRGLLIELADKLGASRPGDAVILYRRVIPGIVEQTNNTAYEQAIKLIRKVGVLMSEHDQLPRLNDFVAELHMQFKPKRNFIKLLNEVARNFAK